MRKGEIFQRVEISDEGYRLLKNAEKDVESAKVYKRIQAFKLMYKKWKYSDIADFLSVTRNTISNWIAIYLDGGISSLILLNYKGGRPNLSEEELSELRKEASKGNFSVAKKAQHYIETKFNIKYGLRHVQLLLKKKFTYPLNEQD